MKSSKRSTPAASSKAGSTKNPLKSRGDPQERRSKANREDIRKEARRVNVARQSKWPAERSK